MEIIQRRSVPLLFSEDTYLFVVDEAKYRKKNSIINLIGFFVVFYPGAVSSKLSAVSFL